MIRKSFKFSILLPEWKEIEPTWKKVEDWFINLNHNLQRRYQKAKLDFQKKVHLGTSEAIKQDIHIVDGGTAKPTRRISTDQPFRETQIHVDNDETIKEEINRRTKEGNTKEIYSPPSPKKTRRLEFL